ncbi:hypothetical protein E2493_19250 [Sphingomonas parva]|uniref:Uncharacterized protein n=1 Tax=Sphingomonas parva TaxID=2555898 RepID=A0A4Y8ZMX9_9SPHN|nr:hypothetical protein [Sphingomonas parva]TFI56622.1 hypothetical protein E2493_19250 [Sphingomonas parva]
MTLKTSSLFMPVAAILAAAVVAPAPAQQGWQRYTQNGLSAEFLGEPERFDKWTDIAKGRVIQLTETRRDGAGDLKAFYFLQAVIADQPYDAGAKIAGDIAEAKGGGDVAVSKEFVSQRALKPSEMPLPGMRGTELVYRYGGFGGGGQLETARNMYVGNKWLSVSVRHGEGDDHAAERARFFRSVTWQP